MRQGTSQSSRKIKEKASIKTRFTWEPQNSYCAVQVTGRPDQNFFNALSSNAEPSLLVQNTLHVGVANSYCAWQA